ncbi:MAG: efflux RND transporter periplasmic adaptor subunit, partial [Eubacterium sp.]|nr:efflux RND transporter periplasmic adaptor subunit [Eubacterium sp.]
ISAGASREYSASTIANCKEVFVKVGDKVKKGDKLATFDTTELDSQISSLQVTYNDAAASYNNAVKSQKESKAKLNAVNKKIAPLEKELKKIEKQSNKKTQNNQALSSNSKAVLGADPIIPGGASYAEELAEAVQALEDLVTTINSLADDIETTNALTRVVMQSIADEIAKGTYKPEAIADVVGDAVAKAIKEGIIDETKLVIESGVLVDTIEAAVEGINWSEIGESFAHSENVELTTVELQLAALYAEREIFSLGADSTAVNAQKQVMNSSKSALNTLKKAQSELQAGWVSSISGVVTECNVEKGAQTSALQTGIKVENLKDLVATISLGEYDVHKVRVGMAATVKSAFGTYSGEIISIAPTATGGNSNSIMDSVGSMAGISGLSSLTDSGAGVECVVSINEPDDNIIAGFEANVEIKTGDFSGVPVVPIESIILEKDGTYVYKYNEEEETVSKTKIETGATSDTAYEVVSGLSIGDKIVSTPAADYEEETFKVRVN